MAWWQLFQRKIKTVKGLSNQERWLLAKALLLLPWVSLSVHSLGYRQTQAWLCRFAVTSSHLSSQETIIKTTQMVKIAVRYSRLWTNCLKQSLVLWALLRGQGVASEIRIGVKLHQGQFTAHAWVEYDGIVLNDRPDVSDQFAPLETPVEVRL